MKKIIILLVAAYVGMVAFQFYEKDQLNKKWTDERWRYFKQVIIGSPFNEIRLDQIPRWNGDIKIGVEGNPTKQDLNTLKQIVSQIKGLIAPKKIVISNNNPNLTITFQDKTIGRIGPKKLLQSTPFTRKFTISNHICVLRMKYQAYILDFARLV